ncbi:hypothetical protein CHLNCDRAFT_137154 [Chlorella variabilis]|uniref:Uncharacterized protein n=1 Tax=Chlorella variabilis TaxID=554065 RepID=E1ZLC9_CHLVA|nr:hypothetical protein CHLNCDRAFT_137154 [Chlorella variabilis]EFN53244.1 hypothetical protein CHLNCDRAFT_137154 [Chlorella variabilis]|eukprot:XP_005845346.1 hypothetical protein CHLNCDRAFT_137154 [Chlorella variabilis]
MGLLSPRRRSGSAAGSEDGSTNKLATLERNWRRVASTHTLQDLMDADDPAKQRQGADLKLLALGVLLILIGAVSLALGVFAIVVAPLLPPLAHPWLASVQRDRYYQLLLPLTVPVTIAAITLNWFSMKLFKHNS